MEVLGREGGLSERVMGTSDRKAVQTPGGEEVAPLAGEPFREEGVRGRVGWDRERTGAERQRSTPGLAPVACSVSNIDSADNGGPGEEGIGINGEAGGGVFICR